MPWRDGTRGSGEYPDGGGPSCWTFDRDPIVRLTVGELAAVMARAEREHMNRSEAFGAALAAWAHAA